MIDRPRTALVAISYKTKSNLFKVKVKVHLGVTVSDLAKCQCQANSFSATFWGASLIIDNPIIFLLFFPKNEVSPSSICLECKIFVQAVRNLASET